MVVLDHCLVVRLFGLTLMLYLLFMMHECFSDPLYYLWRHLSNKYRLCWQRLPCRGVAPVNIGAIAALVGTTMATPYEK